MTSLAHSATAVLGSSEQRKEAARPYLQRKIRRNLMTWDDGIKTQCDGGTWK